MCASNVLLLLSALLSFAFADLSRRALNDPVAKYLQLICLPLLSDDVRTDQLNLTTSDDIVYSLANSPFPCEQQLYLEYACRANGTTAIDFLAEQECLCDGSYFTVAKGCDACYLAHGYQDETPEQMSTVWTSLSIAECAPTPPFQPFSNLGLAFNLTSLSLSPSLTLGNDRFPNMTAVSNYFTETGRATAGAITGSATARLTSWTNTDEVRFTPTSIPPNSGTGSGRVATISATESRGSSTSQSTNAGITKGSGYMGNAVAVGLGVLAML